MSHPDPRVIRRALNVLERLPQEALADLAERLIDRLDGAEPDPDLEPDHDGEPDNADACEAGDDDPASSLPCHGVTGVREVGDPVDAEPDNEDRDAAEDEPRFLTLRAERDGFVTVRRRPVVAVIYLYGRPVCVQSVRWERRE